ncbi:hypothetical protein D3C77_507440 [compost metagenome]
MVDQRGTGEAVQIQAGAFEHQAAIASNHQRVAEQVTVLVAFDDARVVQVIMQLRQGNAAAANEHRLWVVCLITGHGPKQSIVDERLERPATGLRGEHRLQADTGTADRARALGNLQVHRLGYLSLHLLQLCLMLILADDTQRLLQRQALACGLRRACAEQDGKTAKG